MVWNTLVSYINFIYKENIMKINGYDVTFEEGGWGWKPVANGVALSQSFFTIESAVEWLKRINIKFEISFAKAQLEWDHMSDE